MHNYRHEYKQNPQTGVVEYKGSTCQTNGCKDKDYFPAMEKTLPR